MPPSDYEEGRQYGALQAQVARLETQLALLAVDVKLLLAFRSWVFGITAVMSGLVSFVVAYLFRPH